MSCFTAFATPVKAIVSAVNCTSTGSSGSSSRTTSPDVRNSPDQLRASSPLLAPSTSPLCQQHQPVMREQQRPRPHSAFSFIRTPSQFKGLTSTLLLRRSSSYSQLNSELDCDEGSLADPEEDENGELPRKYAIYKTGQRFRCASDRLRKGRDGVWRGIDGVAADEFDSGSDEDEEEDNSTEGFVTATEGWGTQEDLRR
ncbi:hypothetical protein SAICODRAFT_17320 [Saitoella complicata NRRL Y-17804]|uniref:Uncharacterized protein n=1 Tax=Saitoella complicata (strain BCRC 22490 / CBS 7301 / JCM 7358 / NBRC 10748 / NRRL Y-17804) TaxID=698492 RepID=A0A0E9NIV0_SAICN|nr:uncharacterized protein SAICODRAFT_17320 [Saitoella complicata NRRL Y-17804]ODQ54894.1 hypothetical protein SAICODRAFT_17320 [Saitoella complicata NRRL Y-17804]GAO49797.1 hypothetical protein G7K_3937-t1 [Saitoella complicata NRRL Y-17804]